MADRAVALDEVRPAVADLLRQAGADFGILFGSRARGDQLADSDVDLVVVARAFAGMPWLARIQSLQRLWGSPLTLEALPYTPQEWRRRRATSGVLQAALREGIRIRPGGAAASGARRRMPAPRCPLVADHPAPEPARGPARGAP